MIQVLKAEFGLLVREILIRQINRALSVTHNPLILRRFFVAKMIF